MRKLLKLKHNPKFNARKNSNIQGKMSKFFTVHTKNNYYEFNLDHITLIKSDDEAVVIEMASGSTVTLRDGKKEEEFYRCKFLKAFKEAKEANQ